MPLFTWKENYAIGLPEIDAEHAHLFELADRLHAAIGQGASRESTKAHLARLIDQSRAHFASEEEFMIQCGYPSFEEHRAQHDSLLKAAVKMQRDFVAKKAAVKPETLKSLKSWLRLHIEEYDRRIADHLKRA